MASRQAQSKEQQERAMLEYNLIWMERTFKTRAVTESLLAPERDSGRLTQHDYEAAVNFLPGIHRHYNTIGTGLGGSLGFAMRRPHWSTGKLANMVILGAVTGRAVGSGIAVLSHYRFIQSIQNPVQFSQAMESVQKRLAQPGAGGAIPSQVDSPDPDDAFHGSVPFSTPHPTSAEPEAVPSPPQTSSPAGAWERIRAANSRTAQNSSWDAIRQGHEKARIPSQPNEPNEATPEDDNRFRDTLSRAEEQARFDALLEKERDFK